jgi:hypothetical protein
VRLLLLFPGGVVSANVVTRDAAELDAAFGIVDVAATVASASVDFAFVYFKRSDDRFYFLVEIELLQTQFFFISGVPEDIKFQNFRV